MQETKQPVMSQNALLANYLKSAQNNKDVFDKLYDAALELMGKDKLIKPASSINSAVVRKTTTQGLYKVIINNLSSSPEIKMIDEAQLVNNRQYCAGTVSKIDDDEYEVTYFDEDDEIVIEHFDKAGVVDFMNEKRLVFQL